MALDSNAAAMILAMPTAIEPYYAHAAANAPVLLCRAPVAMTGQVGTARYRGEFRLDWLPRPAILADMKGDVDPLTFEAVMGADTVTSEPELPTDRVPAPPQRSAGRRAGASWQERFLNLEVGNPRATLERGLLHLANWPHQHGSPVRYSAGWFDPSRIPLACDRWVITLERTRGGDDRAKAAAASGGYALTHVAEARRPNGQAFATSDLRDLDVAFSYLGSLAGGTRCGGVLPVGFEASGHAAWSQWSTGWVDGMVGAWSWLDWAHPEQLIELFPGFMARWSDPYWQRVLRLAVRYYVETNAPSTVDLAVALAQVVLEMLSYAWLVIERKLRTEEEFNTGRHRATRNIRDMLNDMGIPVAIPDKLSYLAAWRADEGLDGPWAIAAIRNELIHARPSVDPVDYEPRIQAWTLAAWYVELAILRMCNYSGVYRDRIRGEPYVGTVDPVPWAV